MTEQQERDPKLCVRCPNPRDCRKFLCKSCRGSRRCGRCRVILDKITEEISGIKECQYTRDRDRKEALCIDCEWGRIE